MSDCIFCQLATEKGIGRLIDAEATAFCIHDAYPVTDGHTLLIPRRHIESFFETTAAERADLFCLISRAKERLDAHLHPDSYNIGINDGAAAGQTIPHLHIHLIPRYADAWGDPRGGVRWIIPEKANYWD